MASLSPVLPYSRPAVPAAEQDLRRRLQGLELEQDSVDRFLRETREELDTRDRRARRFVKLTDFAGNAVKPLAIASLVGMGFNPLFGLGLLGSIAVLAGAFWFRGQLHQENARLVQADKQLQGLEAAAQRVRDAKAPLERQLQEIEWIKQAAGMEGTLRGRRPDIDVQDDAVTIGGIRLERRA